MRTAGKTGVAVGTLVWAAPLVQTTVPAWAAEGSGVPDPHSNPPHSDPPPNPHTTGGSDTTAGDSGVLAADETRTNNRSNGGGGVIAPDGFDLAGLGELARTGADPWNLVKLAGGAIAIGGAARAVGRKLEQPDHATELGDDGGCVEA